LDIAVVDDKTADDIDTTDKRYKMWRAAMCLISVDFVHFVYHLPLSHRTDRSGRRNSITDLLSIFCLFLHAMMRDTRKPIWSPLPLFSHRDTVWHVGS